MENKKFYKRFHNLSQDKLNSRFLDACENGDIELVKYLLLSSDLERHANIDTGYNLGFRTACVNGHLEIVKYLLEQPILCKNMIIESGFEYACINGKLEVVKHLLL
jgi:ankyrin repeat protein